MMFGGPPGLGKTSLVQSLAVSRDVDILEVKGPQFKEEMLAPAIAGKYDEKGKQTKGFNSSGYDKRGFLVEPSKARPSILFIDEAESVDPKLWETCHGLLEPGPDGRRILRVKIAGLSRRVECWSPAISVIIATNYVGRLKKRAAAALNRCGIKWMFEPYSEEHLITIIKNAAAAEKVMIDRGAVAKIANRSIGIPRTAKSLLDRCINRHIASGSKGVTEKVVDEALEMLGIDDLGLEQPSRDYLLALAAEPAGKISVDSIAAIIGVDKETIIVDIEPFLMRQGLVRVVSGGRQITDNGLLHVGGNQVNPLHRHVLSNLD
jgi:Holliday junction DNA helicase RuvB